MTVLTKSILALTGILMFGLPAAAQNTAPIVVPQPSVGDTLNLQNRQQRENFRLQQQINRDVQGLEMRRRQPRIEVPVMKPRCRPNAYGIGC